MKKVFVPIISLIILSILMFVIFTSASESILDTHQALQIGEEKYLKFLWMIDGAFNSERLQEDFTVNDQVLSEEDKVFTCKYKNAKAVECVGKNFESEFANLFSKNIKYERVYSDEAIYSWISLKNGEYVFNNLNTCSINRMGINHKLRVIKINNDKIVYEVTFTNRRNNQLIKRDFGLILEDGVWKISNAFYYDLCGMWYTIY